MAVIFSTRRPWRSAPHSVSSQAGHDLEGQGLSDEAGAERQDVGVVVLAAVARRREVVAVGGAHAGHLVGGHGRADAGAVDDDAPAAAAVGHEPRRPQRRGRGSRPRRRCACRSRGRRSRSRSARYRWRPSGASRRGHRRWPPRPAPSVAGAAAPRAWRRRSVRPGPGPRRRGWCSCQSWASTHSAVGFVGTSILMQAGAQGGEGDGATTGPGCEADGEPLAWRVMRAAGPPCARRGEGRAISPSRVRKRPSTSPTAPARSSRFSSRAVEVARRDVDRLSVPISAHAEDRAGCAAGDLEGLADRRVGFQRPAQLGAADDGRGRHQPHAGAGGGAEPLHDLLVAGGSRRARDGAVELHDLAWPRSNRACSWAASSSMVLPHETPIAPPGCSAARCSAAAAATRSRLSWSSSSW